MIHEGKDKDMGEGKCEEQKVHWKMLWRFEGAFSYIEEDGPILIANSSAHCCRSGYFT